MMGWQSFNSDASNQTTASSASLEMLLNERQVDPEMMLLNLGFGGQAPQYVPTMARVPARFLKQPSKAQGVATPWLSRQESDGDSGQDGEEDSGNRSPVASAVQSKRKPGGLVFKGLCYHSCQGYVDLLKLFLNRNVPSHFFNTLGSKCYKVVAGDDDLDEEGDEELKKRGEGLEGEEEEICLKFQVPSLLEAEQSGNDHLTDEFQKVSPLMRQGPNTCSQGTLPCPDAFSNNDLHPAQLSLSEPPRAPSSLLPTVFKTDLTNQSRGSSSSSPKTSSEGSRFQANNLNNNRNCKGIMKERCQPLVGSSDVGKKISKHKSKTPTMSSSETFHEADSRAVLKTKSLPASKSNKTVAQKLPLSETTSKTSTRPRVPKTQFKTTCPPSSVAKADTSPSPSFSSPDRPTIGRDEQRKEDVFEKNYAAVSNVNTCSLENGQSLIDSDDASSAEENTRALPKVVELEETEPEIHQYYHLTPSESKTNAQMPVNRPSVCDTTNEEEKSLTAVQLDQIQALGKSFEFSTQIPPQSCLLGSRRSENILSEELFSSYELHNTNCENKDSSDEMDTAIGASIQPNASLDSSLTSESSNTEIGDNNPIFQELLHHSETTLEKVGNESEDYGDNDDRYDWMEDDEDDSDSNEPIHDLRSLNEMLHRMDETSPEIAIINALNEDDVKASDEESERLSDSPEPFHVPSYEDLKKNILNSFNVNDNDVMVSERRLPNGDHDPCALTSASSIYNTSSPYNRDRNSSNQIDPDAASSQLKSPASVDFGRKVQTNSPEEKENCQPEPCSSLPDELGTCRSSSYLQSSNSNVSCMATTAISTFTPTPIVVTVRVVGDIQVSCVPSQKLRVTDPPNLSSAKSNLSVTDDVTHQPPVSKKPSPHIATRVPASLVSKSDMPMSYKSEIHSFSLKRPKSIAERHYVTATDLSSKPVTTRVAVFSTSIGTSLPSLTTKKPSTTVVHSALHIAPPPSLSSSSSSSSLLPFQANFLHGLAGPSLEPDIASDNDNVTKKFNDFSEMDSSFIISSSSSSDDDDDDILMFSEDRHGL